MPKTQFSQQDYVTFCHFLEKNCGIVLGDSKQYLVKSRLTPLLSEYVCDNLPQLLKKIELTHERKLRNHVIDAMTTNETLWFRDTYPFEVLSKRLLPEFSKLNRPLKIWSAACSSGQEPYSIAMTCLEFQAKNPTSLKYGFDITATDISDSMLSHSKKGVYDSLALSRGLSADRLKNFFTPTEKNCYEIKANVKQKVKFKSFNLLGNYASLGKFDIVFCRNVMIYFSPEVKKKIFQNFSNVINDEGYIMLGASESISGLSDSFKMERCESGIVYRRKK